ncbi:MAG: ABC transporter permease, partial [Chloroflexi bacterium]|nr:ABC transporter permease [Chloroflexota bacterium]
MEEIFGLSMNVLMMIVLAIFLAAMAVLTVLAVRNRIMLKMGLRPIPRRLGQTVLIIVGVMLSTVIISAAFGTGDTISFSIRSQVLEELKTIDEVIIPARAKADDSFGSAPYVPFRRFEELRAELAGFEEIDGLMPQIGESVPAVNLRTSQSEGSMRVAGVAPDLLEGFGTFTLTSGEDVRLDDLLDDEAYINDKAAEELEAVAGDELRLFIDGQTPTFKVKGVVERGGLAGRDSTLILPLARAQRVFGRVGEINSIVVSNRGDVREGAELSKQVTRKLRVLHTDRGVASQLKGLLDQEEVLKALEEREESLAEHMQRDISELRKELQGAELSDELISLLADHDVVDVVFDVLEENELKEVDREARTLFDDLVEFRVIEVKRRGLDFADDVGSGVTTFFMLFSLFSIAVGILLIFLIFVMLASARRSEMGMARAVGAKRRHLVQMFTFEGTAYSLVSAAVGVVLGLAISAGMIVIINRLIASFDEDSLQLSIHFEPRTVIVSYCVGMIITFATVAVSSYRVSRLNIVTAVRGLPEAIVLRGEAPFSQRLLLVGRALVRPFVFLWQAIRSIPRLRVRRVLLNLGLTALWAMPPVWGLGIAVALVRFSWPYVLRGWLLLLLGALVTWWGIAGLERLSVFTAGVSLMILGLGLMLRVLAVRRRMPLGAFGVLILLGGAALLALGILETSVLTIIIAAVSVVVGASMAAPFVLGRVEGRPDVIDRLAYTFIGVVMLVFWTLPSDAFPDVIVDLQGDFDMMFVSGIFMVSAAVWTVMYNADLLLRALTFVTARFGHLRPVLVMAVAYPMSNKFRTGLTLAMFSLVIFSLMVMSILSEIFGTQFADAETVTGGWDINAEVNPRTPIEDVRRSIDDEPDLRIEDFEAIGGYTWVGVQARQLEGESQKWEEQGVRAADDEFLRASEYKFKLIAEGYGTTGEEVWQALMSDPSLAVVGGNMVSSSEGSDRQASWLEKPFYKDEKMSVVDVEVREPRSGALVQLKIIGVLDRIHENSDTMIVSKSILDDAIPFPVPITNYRFKVADGVDAKEVARSMEASFLEHGMDTEVLEEELEKEAAAAKTFFRLFIGFMALGLLVGVAGLGVVSTRAVVERRQQIGVLRAIGYRRRMIQLSFLLESSFIALLGILIGTTLGIVLGWQAYNDIKEEEGIDAIRFSIPWIQIGVILAVTYAASLLATFLPAR